MSTAETEGQELDRAGGARLPAEDAAHPGPREYVMIAVILAVVTGLEVALFYLDFLPTTAVVTGLLLLMTIKFALVVLWFMHLRFDPPVFKRLFLTGLALALSVFLVVLLTFGAGLAPAVLAVGFVVILLFAFLVRPRFLRRA